MATHKLNKEQLKEMTSTDIVNHFASYDYMSEVVNEGDKPGTAFAEMAYEIKRDLEYKTKEAQEVAERVADVAERFANSVKEFGVNGSWNSCGELQSRGAAMELVVGELNQLRKRANDFARMVIQLAD